MQLAGEAIIVLKHEQLRCLCVDLSAGGLAVIAPRAAKMLERVRVHTRFGDEQLVADALVVRDRRQGTGYLWGMRFINLDDMTRANLKRYVQHVLSMSARRRQAHLFTARIQALHQQREQQAQAEAQSNPQIPAVPPGHGRAPNPVPRQSPAMRSNPAAGGVDDPNAFDLDLEAGEPSRERWALAEAPLASHARGPESAATGPAAPVFDPGVQVDGEMLAGESEPMEVVHPDDLPADDGDVAAFLASVEAEYSQSAAAATAALLGPIVPPDFDEDGDTHQMFRKDAEAQAAPPKSVSYEDEDDGGLDFEVDHGDPSRSIPVPTVDDVLVIEALAVDPLEGMNDEPVPPREPPPEVEVSASSSPTAATRPDMPSPLPAFPPVDETPAPSLDEWEANHRDPTPPPGELPSVPSESAATLHEGVPAVDRNGGSGAPPPSLQDWEDDHRTPEPSVLPSVGAPATGGSPMHSLQDWEEQARTPAPGSLEAVEAMREAQANVPAFSDWEEQYMTLHPPRGEESPDPYNQRQTNELEVDDIEELHTDDIYDEEMDTIGRSDALEPLDRSEVFMPEAQRGGTVVASMEELGLGPPPQITFEPAPVHSPSPMSESAYSPIMPPSYDKGGTLAGQAHTEGGTVVASIDAIRAMEAGTTRMHNIGAPALAPKFDLRVNEEEAATSFYEPLPISQPLPSPAPPSSSLPRRPAIERDARPVASKVEGLDVAPDVAKTKTKVKSSKTAAERVTGRQELVQEALAQLRRRKDPVAEGVATRKRSLDASPNRTRRRRRMASAEQQDPSLLDLYRDALDGLDDGGKFK